MRHQRYVWYWHEAQQLVAELPPEYRGWADQVVDRSRVYDLQALVNGLLATDYGEGSTAWQRRRNKQSSGPGGRKKRVKVRRSKRSH